MPSGIRADLIEDSTQRRKDTKERDTRPLCAFASLRFIQTERWTPCPAEGWVVATSNPPIAKFAKQPYAKSCAGRASESPPGACWRRGCSRTYPRCQRTCLEIYEQNTNMSSFLLMAWSDGSLFAATREICRRLLASPVAFPRVRWGTVAASPNLAQSSAG